MTIKKKHPKSLARRQEIKQPFTIARWCPWGRWSEDGRTMQVCPPRKHLLRTVK